MSEDQVKRINIQKQSQIKESMVDDKDNVSYQFSQEHGDFIQFNTLLGKSSKRSSLYQTYNKVQMDQVYRH